MGFGDAVKCAEGYVGKEDFVVHAGDVTILSKSKHPILRLIETSKKYPDAKAILLCKNIINSKKYGVPTISKISNNLFNVTEVVEKQIDQNHNLEFYRYIILNRIFFQA